MRMILYLAGLELRSLLRGGTALVMIALLLVLIGLSTALGVQRVQGFEAERIAASKADRQIWIEQGADNPHAAAHFARYAFKPVPALSLFDPGALDTAGIAIWMEGHYQDPAQFRRIEDAPLGLRIAQLSPAWVLIIFGSLVVFVALHASVAGEREDGTLRQVLSTGLDPRVFVAGKMLGAFGFAVGLLMLALLTATITAANANLRFEADWMLRFGLLAGAYSLFFITLAGIAIGVSGLCRDRRSALGALIALWAAIIVIGPFLLSQLALILHPDVDGPSVQARITAASNAYFSDAPAREQALQAALSRYGVETKAELPLRYDGYELQYSEELAHPKFEAIYAEIDELHDQQENVLTLGSIIMPSLSTFTLSATLAGTDRAHHQAFSEAAEAHRRRIVKMLNDDLTFNRLDAEGPYVADRELWEQIPDFEMASPTIASTTSNLSGPFALAAVQALLALLFAIGVAARTARRVTQ
jgi:ABC-2 type transport system permease protein